MAGLSAIILAAGQGTRMRSDLPKVAHEVAGKPIVRWVAEACAAAGCDRVVVVVGYKQEIVRGAMEGFAGADVAFVEQSEQLGTGHAVMVCRDAFASGLEGGGSGDVFVLAGDGPLIRAETLGVLHGRHTGAGASATLATSRLEDPSGYGRIVRDGAGGFERIVEQKNATEAELRIDEVNPSYYCFGVSALFDALASVGRDSVSGEYYVTDVPRILLERGDVVEVIDAVPAEDVLSINTPEQLAEVDRVMRGRLEGVS